MDFRAWLKNGLNKWRLALLVFIVIYAFLLLLNLGLIAIQWDETPHLYGGLLLTHGKMSEYISTYGYYPPLYDLITTGYFKVFGISVFAGRLAAVTFALLSVWIVFEFACRTYGPKIALISSILLGSMPGFFWVSNFALLETMLVFFFSLTMFFFFTWIRLDQKKALILSGLALGLGFLAKYQILVAGIIMIASILLLCRDRLKAKFSRFPLLAVTAIAVVVPWLLIIGTGKLGDLLYAIQVGGEDRPLYSARFPLPIFYLIEMTWPYYNTHPIFLPIYILGLLGLGLWIYRRKPEDLFFLTWFVGAYVFFTLIPNKQWRYVTPVFPVLAISAAGFIFSAYNRIKKAWESTGIRLNKKRVIKVAAGLFVVFSLASVFYSYYDGQQFVARYQIFIPIEEATDYAASRLSSNESIMVLAASNSYNQDMVKFYLHANASRQNQVLQYPELPVDAFTPSFDVNEAVALCQEHNVKYVFLYEYGATFPYFNSTLTLHEIYVELLDSGRFTYVTIFGTSPRTISILSFA